MMTSHEGGIMHDGFYISFDNEEEYKQEIGRLKRFYDFLDEKYKNSCEPRDLDLLIKEIEKNYLESDPNRRDKPTTFVLSTHMQGLFFILRAALIECDI